KFRFGKYVEYGASPRASIGLYIASKADALLNGKSYVTPQNIKAVAHDVLRHRIILNYEGQAENVNTDDFITEILSKVPIP
ncbi:ATPase, partial [Candidatus Woesearchaeota archaeon]|nr:ATPase [Candidatus Woesearchaeota archaeon]